MSEVLHGTSSDLARICAETVLGEEIALGIIHLDTILPEQPDDIYRTLDLAGVTSAMRQAWENAGYPGTLSEFMYAGPRSIAVSPHIDQKNGTGFRAQPRAVVLSMGRTGLARVYAQQYPAALNPGDQKPDATALQEMRHQATRLDTASMPICIEHGPNDVLVIPTLPYPTAHAVEIVGDARTTELWDCMLNTN